MELTSKTLVAPWGKKFIVLPIGTQTISKGGIIIPETAQNKPGWLARVLSVGDGDGEKGWKKGVKKGSILVIGRFAGTELPLSDKPETEWPRVISVDEILGVVV